MALTIQSIKQIEILTFPLTIWQTAAFSEALHSHPLSSPSCQGNTHELHLYVTTKNNNFE